MTTHFIGIGGIGMSALARILLQQGQKVQGSDKQRSALVEELVKEGAVVPGELSPGDTVVYSTDIPADHSELKRAKELGLELLHRSALLHRILTEKKPLLVTGTHGKTTTTALLASVLLEGGLDPTFAIGGISLSHNTNGRVGKGPYSIAESDESDGSFLVTPAYGAIVTNLEKEHLSYWKTEEKLTEGFREFCKKVRETKHLFWCGDDQKLDALSPGGIAYGFSEGCPCRILSFTPTEQGLTFDLRVHGKVYQNIQLSLFGKHNALNGAAVFGLALSLGVDEMAIRRAFQAFGGTARRLEKIGIAQNIEIYDDYGHHPTEIKVTLKALRDRVYERRLVVLFQPHRYSRVSDLCDEFATSFEDADLVLMTDIYAAGERKIECNLYAKLKEQLGARLQFFKRGELLSGALSLLQVGDAALTLGAGDITQVGRELLREIPQKIKKLKVTLLFGGTSPEHEVSVLSAGNVEKALDLSLYDIEKFKVEKDGTWLSPEVFSSLRGSDVCIPMFHGAQGEDGMIQGFLETLSLAYVGCDYQSSAICMQKAWTKHIALMNGIPTAPYYEWSSLRHREAREELEKHIPPYPVWVKPVHLGSSIGVRKVGNREELEEALELAFQLDDVVIVEQHVEGRQIEFALLGNDVIRMGEPGEILNDGEFYTYDQKYGPQASPIQTPADLTEIEAEIGQELAKRIYHACGCKGLCRADFFLDQNGHYWLNELNPMPGFTSKSAYPKMWMAAGWTWEKLFNELIILALHRHRSL